MRLRDRATLLPILLAAMVVLPLVGRPARAEGPGIKLGESLVLHPGIAIGAGYDSNVFYSSGNSASDQPIGAAYLAAKVALDLSTLSLQRGGDTPHSVDFRFHAGMPLRFLFAVDQRGQDAKVNHHYSIGAEGGLLLSLFPFGNWTFDIFDNFIRTSEPPYFASNAEQINLDQNQAGVRLRWRPGGKRFEASLQYAASLFWYETVAFQAKNALIHDMQFRLKWNFFPKTALYINVDQTINTYVHQDDPTFFNVPPSAYPIRAVAGLLGLITAKLSVNLNVGYGNSLTQNGSSKDASGQIAYPLCSSLMAGDARLANGQCTKPYNMVIGLVEADWKPTELTLINLGYRHDFNQVSVIGAYYSLDNAYLGISQQLWRLVFSTRLGFEYRIFNGNLGPDGLVGQTATDPDRRDKLLLFHAQVDLPIKDWLILSLGYDLSRNWSNCQLNPNLTAQPLLLPCDYLRNDVWLRMAFAY